MQDIFFLEKKLEARVDELLKYRYVAVQELDNWFIQEDETKQEKYPPDSLATKTLFNKNDVWRGRDTYLWIQKQVKLPNASNSLFYFDFGKTGGGGNSGFEALLFIDGQPYQGVDSNHKEVFVNESLAGKDVVVSLKLWSGLEGGGIPSVQQHVFKAASLQSLDIATDQLYYTGKMILKTIKQLNDRDAVKYQLEQLLDKCFKFIDYSDPYSIGFYQSIHKAFDYLSTELDKLPNDSLIKFSAIGHTHIDVAWLWRLKHTREKAARSFSTVLRLMEKYPEYIFLQSQPQIYKYIKEDYPEIYQKIQERVQEGRWEIDGAMWLEADCNIPSGESLTRQILHGKQFIKKEFDQDSRYLWLPDVFGYSWALPQILKKSGIDTFMTTKISWNQYNRMPHDTFWWRGIDGTEILTHFITTPEIDYSDRNSWFYTYNGHLEPETLLGSYDGYQDKNINNDLLLAYGYGDGGGGVTRDMLEKRRVLDKIPGLPSVKTEKAGDYFARLHETFENTEQYVHTWDGELYLEYHRGTYTSQAKVKKMNRKTELALRELEILYSWQHQDAQLRYPAAELYSAWEMLLRNQFHDIIPGSSIHEVYQDYEKELGTVNDKLRELTEQLETGGKAVTVVNTAGWKRDSLITIPGENIVLDELDQVLPQVHRAGETIVFVKDVSPLGTKQLKISDRLKQEEVAQSSLADVGKNSLETDFYEVAWNQAGHLIKLYDKLNKREVLKGQGNVFQLFEDKPVNYDAWDIDIFYQEKSCDLSADTIMIEENNSLFTSIKFHYSFGKSTISQLMYLYKHTSRIDFKTIVDWHERQKLLKVKFPVNVRSTEATYDIQYGNVKRATHWNTTWDLAKFETVAHQWADLSDRRYGISLLNDCKYGYDIKGNVMRLSLLKGAIHPDPTADIGEQTFTYSLLPHCGDFIEGKTVEEAWEINQPLTILAEKTVKNDLVNLVSEEPVVIDAIKQSENGDGTIIRIHDHMGCQRKIKIAIPTNCCWCETNLMEETISKYTEGPIEVEVTPYEIRTFKLLKR